jgi:hypothetical protein
MIDRQDYTRHLIDGQHLAIRLLDKKSSLLMKNI